MYRYLTSSIFPREIFGPERSVFIRYLPVMRYSKLFFTRVFKAYRYSFLIKITYQSQILIRNFWSKLGILIRHKGPNPTGFRISQHFVRCDRTGYLVFLALLWTQSRKEPKVLAGAGAVKKIWLRLLVRPGNFMP
jgi:hypothetical protein